MYRTPSAGDHETLSAVENLFGEGSGAMTGRGVLAEVQRAAGVHV